MKQIRIVGVPVIVAVVLGAGLVGVASATAPEFGRCLKVATKSLSNFDNAKCVKHASEDSGTEEEKLKKGNFQWSSGVVKNKFTTKIKEATIATLETVGGTKITCTGETSDGEFKNPKEVGGLHVKFTGCETNKLKCESAGAGIGNINTAPLGGKIGFEVIAANPVNSKIANELHSESGNIAEFECAGLKVVVRGCVLHKITANAMKLTATEKFTASKGIQKPDHFAGGTPGECVLETSTNGGPFERSGQTITGTITGEEKVEASTIN